MKLNDDGTILIDVGPDDINSDGSFNVPEGVVGIGPGAFEERFELKTVTFPEGLHTIGDEAFIGCLGLKTVTLPEGLHTISTGAFWGCSNLKTVTFAKGLHTIGSWAFGDCYGLKTVTLPEGLHTIGEGAFCHCSGLETVTFPEGLHTIGDGAFENCHGLKTVTLPEGLHTIGTRAFDNCSELKTVTFPEGLHAIGTRAFKDCRHLETLTLPEGLHTIGEGAFRDCWELEAVTLPEGLHTIGEGVFDCCRKLETVTLPAGLQVIHPRAFTFSTKLRTIIIQSTDTDEHERITRLLLVHLHTQVIPMELANEVFSCLNELLETVAQTPALNPLHPSFNSYYAKDTGLKGAVQSSSTRCHALPPELLQAINSFIIEDNLFYQSAQQRLRGVPLPENKEGFEAYKKQLEVIAEEVIHEAQEFLRAQRVFENQLKSIAKKEVVLRQEGHLAAADAARTLHQTISTSYQNVFPKNRHQFKQECQKAFNDARPHLELHRGWKLILSYLALALTGLGCLIILADLGHKKATGTHFRWFQTDTAQKLSATEDTLTSVLLPR